MSIPIQEEINTCNSEVNTETTNNVVDVPDCNTLVMCPFCKWLNELRSERNGEIKCTHCPNTYIINLIKSVTWFIDSGEFKVKCPHCDEAQIIDTEKMRKCICGKTFFVRDKNSETDIYVPPPKGAVYTL